MNILYGTDYKRNFVSLKGKKVMVLQHYLSIFFKPMVKLKFVCVIPIVSGTPLV